MDQYIARRVNDPRFRAADRSVKPWYANEARSVSTAAAPSNALHRPTFKRESHKFAKRKKDYSSDSSESEKETDGHVEHRIYRAPKGSSKEFYVYHEGKKISFGDPHMKNRNDNKERRENFNARHNCAEKKDKSKAGYWACRVWRKGYRGPS